MRRKGRLMKNKFTINDLIGILIEMIKVMLPMITTILVLLLLSGGLL